MGVGGQYHTPATLPRERLGTHCIGGWVGLRAGLDRCGISRPPLGFNPQIIQPIVSRNTNHAIPAPYFYAYKIIFKYIMLNYFWPGKTRLASDLAATFECLPHHCSNA